MRERIEWEAVRAAAHAFKSACRTMRASRLATMLQCAETAGAEDRVCDVKGLLPRIDAECKKVMAFLGAVASPVG